MVQWRGGDMVNRCSSDNMMSNGVYWQMLLGMGVTITLFPWVQADLRDGDGITWHKRVAK